MNVIKNILSILLVSLLLLFALNSNEAFAEITSRSEWEKTYGASGTDLGYSIQPTVDGGYIIIGYTRSYGMGENDFWLVKIDASGNKLWDKTFGGIKYDAGWGVQQTSDGGYIITGVTLSYGPGAAWLIKTDASGNKVWDKTLGGGGRGNSLLIANDGGYIIAGISSGAAWLIKTDAMGNTLWEKTYANYVEIESVKECTDGGYIAIGIQTKTENNTIIDRDIYLLKTDVSGNKNWEQIFSNTGSDTSLSVVQTSDSGFIIAGTTSLDITLSQAKDTDYHSWLIKTDISGSKTWDKIISSSYGERTNYIQQTSDGGYLISGTSLVKTDSAGNILWDVSLHNGIITAYSFLETSDGGYIITGSKNSDLWLIKFKDSIGTKPDKPVNNTPANTKSITGLTPVLTTSLFVDKDHGDTHTASLWQIRNSEGTYDNMIKLDGVDLTTMTVPENTLELGKTYYWHVKYRDSSGTWSAWSDETSFTVVEAPIENNDFSVIKVLPYIGGVIIVISIGLYIFLQRKKN